MNRIKTTAKIAKISELINTDGEMCQNPNRLCNRARFALQMIYGSCSRESPLQPLVSVHPSVPVILNGCCAIFRKPFLNNLTRTHEAARTHTYTFIHV